MNADRLTWWLCWTTVAIICALVYLTPRLIG